MEAEQNKIKETLINLIKNIKSNPITAEDIQSLCEELSKSSENGSVDVHKLNLTMNSIVEKLEEKTSENLINYLNDNPNCIQKLINGDSLKTNVEAIINLLQEIETEAKNQKDEESILDIEWIIKTLNEGNIYEIDPTEFHKSHFKSEESKHGLNFLMQYSKIEDLKMKNKDFNAVRRKSIKTKTLTQSDFSKSYCEEGNKEGGITITKEISECLTNQIHKIATSEFDIFSLNNLLQEKASVIVAGEILSQISYVQNGLVPHETLKKFINIVVSSYDRINAIYHNDLHAADVMQTIFSVINKGDLYTVKYFFNF